MSGLIFEDRELIDLANRMVPMTVAARLAGMSVPEGSRKTHCPVEAVTHRDGGREPAFRIYARDAWCFNCREFWTPVKLAAHALEVAPEQAAVQLLERIGYKPASFAHHWHEVSAPSAPDSAALTQALRNHCAAVDARWPERQLDPEVSDYLARCLGYLVQVKDMDAARRWLELSQQVMGAALRRRANADQG